MSTNANGNHESRNNSENRTYTSLIDANGSFGSAFWHNENTNRAASGSNEEAWSTAMNASAAEENVKSRDDKGSGNNGQTKKIKRKA